MNRCRGFTLLEVLIAVALFGLMITMMFTVLHLAARAWEAAEPRAAALNGHLALEGFLRRHLADPLASPAGEEVPPLAGTGNRLSFNSFPPLAVAIRDLQRFTLVQVGESLRVRVVPLGGDAGGEGELRDLELLRGVRRLGVRYFHDGEWQDSWQEKQPPELVEIRVETVEGWEWPPVVVGIRRGAGGGGPMGAFTLGIRK